MNVTYETFLAVLKGALAGERVDPGREISPEEWQRLFAMARIHQVLPLFYDAVYPYIPEEAAALGAEVRKNVRFQVMRQTVKTCEFLEVNRALAEAGVRPLVVKGLICRSLYPNPDARPSGDEDILIPETVFPVCHRILLDSGLATGEPAPESVWEVPYRKDGSPLYIELHKHLFPPESGAYGDLNRFFDGVHERAAEEEIQGNRVYTMDPTDHLLYLILHAFKHFLHSGFGIRQVCDIILFADRYGCRVDWQRILDCCRQIRAERFAAALFGIGSRYLVFDPDMAAYPEAWRQIAAEETPLLEDLLSAGLYGDATLSRKHSSNMTLGAVAAGKQGKKILYSPLAAVFPAPEMLKGNYPWLKRHPWLVPAAWCHRLLKYARETLTAKESDAAQALKIGRERVELMKQYGILE